MTKLNIIGAFDRFNFGDVLLAYILENKLSKFKKKYDFQFVSTSAADLTDKHGFQTISMETMFKNSKKNSVYLVAGGEVLSAPWWYMYLCLVENKLVKNEQQKLLQNGFESANKTAMKHFKCSHQFPWVFERKYFKNESDLLIYNSVGGSSLRKLVPDLRSEIVNNLKSADYISVRDNDSKAIITKSGFPSKKMMVYPDSAMLISDILNKKTLAIYTSSEAKKIVKKSDRYMVFQVGKYHVLNQNSTDIIVRQLLKIVESENIDVILVPFSDASLHEDNIILQKIYLKSKHKRIKLVKKTDIYDIIYYITNAKLFMGTSLHGNIVSFSYSIPTIGLTDVDTKLPRFIETWIKPKLGHKSCYQFSEMHRAFVKYKNFDKFDYNKKRKYAMSKAEENLQNISKLISANYNKHPSFSTRTHKKIVSVIRYLSLRLGEKTN